MMDVKRFLVLFLLSTLLIISGCGDDERVKKQGNFPYKKGNYWVYKTTTTTPDDVVNVFPYLDSVWIETDTLIDGKKYWKQTGTLRGTIFLRDSGDCVLMKELTYEQIIYSTNSRDTLTLTPPTCKILTGVNKTIAVPAGNFRTNNVMSLLRKSPGEPDHGGEYPVFSKDFYITDQYICSGEKGLIKYEYYYLGNTIEYELVRYKIN